MIDASQDVLDSEPEVRKNGKVMSVLKGHVCLSTIRPQNGLE